MLERLILNDFSNDLDEMSLSSIWIKIGQSEIRVKHFATSNLI